MGVVVCLVEDVAASRLDCCEHFLVEARAGTYRDF